MLNSSANCRLHRYSGIVSENSRITSGEISAKITPSMPSKPQPAALAVAMCQWVFVSLSPDSATAR